ncbi:phage late control D family protein [Hydrogenophilus thermoluteolus]|uniref:Bacteriophage regulatory protein n=1 Tax=Hydrogenophilus thermoluteolus TaxID=297 RepID=A0A2Z6DXM3_HYDTE|nr:contractile injection system protein, VgrG/Pvc8 family [Hydrogenophilus thermoluteolus]BBD77246.1 bacteriophage regulatory protein [Hydrogenophilus thermoluteolus]
MPDARVRAIAPVVEVTYNGRDITTDLTPYLTRFVFIDRMTGEADTLDLELGEVKADATRWLAEWYPDKGMELSARFGWSHQELVPAGAFDVDEIEIESPPMAIRIRAQSAGVSRAVRSRIGRKYENTTLKGILADVAQRLGAKLSGKIEPDPAIERATQYGETAWQFAVRIAREYGYTVKLTNNNQTLAVSRLADDQPPVRVLRPSDMTRFSFRDQIADVPARATVRRHDEKTGELIVYGLDAKGQAVPVDKVSVDERVKVTRAANAQDAEARARAEMERHALDKTSLDVELPGDPLLAAGLAVDVTGWGRVDGRYVIVVAEHVIERGSGYTTRLQLKRIADAA